MTIERNYPEITVKQYGQPKPTRFFIETIFKDAQVVANISNLTEADLEELVAETQNVIIKLKEQENRAKRYEKAGYQDLRILPDRENQFKLELTEPVCGQIIYVNGFTLADLEFLIAEAQKWLATELLPPFAVEKPEEILRVIREEEEEE